MRDCHAVYPGCDKCEYQDSIAICLACDSKLGFVLGSPPTSCYVPAEFWLTMAFKVVGLSLIVFVVAGSLLKYLVLGLYAHKNSRLSAYKDRLSPVASHVADHVATPKMLERSPSAVLQAERDLSQTSHNAIKYGIHSMKNKRIMDWSDPDQLKGVCEKNPRYSRLKDRLVPREYPLWFDLNSDFIMGGGVPLFFHFHAMPFFLALLLLAVTRYVTWYSGFQPTWSRDDLEKEYVAIRKFAEAMWVGLGIAYIILLAFSLLFAAFQWHSARRFNTNNSTMMDYTLHLEGLKPTLTSEKELEEFCEKQFGVKVLACAINYDMSLPAGEECWSGLGNAGDVGDLLWGMLERLVIDYDVKFNPMDDPQTAESIRDDAHFGYEENLALSDDRRNFEGDRERFRKLIDSSCLKNAHTANVVFTTKADTNEALSKSDGFIKALLEHDLAASDPHCRIKVKKAITEPPGINWFNYGSHPSMRRYRAFRGSLVFCGFLALICVGVYYPINRHISLPYSLERASPPFFTSQCIGIINGIIGGILIPVLFIVAGRVGYPNKSQFDSWCLNFCIVNSTINFCFGNACVLYTYLIEGFGAINMQDITREAVQGEMRLSRFYGELLFPGMIFTGWIVGKLMGDVWPFVQAFLLTNLVFRIRCLPHCINQMIAPTIPYNPRITAQDGFTSVALSAREAEYIWIPKDFAVAWEYPDKIFNPTICILATFAISAHHWWLFFLLAVWLILVYSYHRFVQLHTYGKYMNCGNHIELLGQRYWAIPLATLATSCAWWGSRLGFFDYRVVCPLAALVTACVYISGVQLLYKELGTDKTIYTNEDDEEYAIMARALLYSWFNCNPVYVLKSHYAPESLGKNHQGKPIPPFFFGKEYLVLSTLGQP